MSSVVAHLAEQLRRRGLARPAGVLLEAHRPLLPLLREAGVALSPMLDPLLGSRGATSVLVDDPTAYDRLLAALDDDQPGEG